MANAKCLGVSTLHSTATEDGRQPSAAFGWEDCDQFWEKRQGAGAVQDLAEHRSGLGAVAINYHLSTINLSLIHI